MSEQLTAEQRVRAIFNRPEITVWQLRLEVLLVNAMEQAEQVAAQRQMERDAAAVCPYCIPGRPSSEPHILDDDGVLVELSGEPGRWRHSYEEYTWECKAHPIRAAFSAAHTTEGVTP